DSDVRLFYDTIKTEQASKLAPHLERLVRLLMLAQDGPTGGEVPPARVEFAPLWQMTPAETAGLRQTVAETDALYVTAGILTAAEVAKSRFRPDGWSAETALDDGLRATPAPAPAPPPPRPTTDAAGARLCVVLPVPAGVAAG